MQQAIENLLQNRLPPQRLLQVLEWLENGQMFAIKNSATTGQKPTFLFYPQITAMPIWNKLYMQTYHAELFTWVTSTNVYFFTFF